MLLAFDTASQFISLALHDGHRLQYEATWHSANNHTVELAPAIRRALAHAGLRPADLAAVAVSQGPGSFTGLRIGMGVAKGLALARSIRLVAVPTLRIVAAGIPAFDGPLIVVLQAGRGRICAQRYTWTGTAWEPDAEAEITSWPGVIDTVEHATLFAGEIEDDARALLDETHQPVHVAPGAVGLRRAGFLAEIAWARVRALDTDDPATVTPIYLHQPGVPHP